MEPSSLANQQNPRRKFTLWIPRFRFYTLFVLTLVSLIVPLVLFAEQGFTGDVWWVWKSGQWMFQHHQILLANPAGWNGASLAHRPWINLEWGWEVFLYGINPHHNPAVFLALLFVLELALMTTFYWAMQSIAPHLAIEWKAFLYTLYVCFFFRFTVKLRAEMFSYIVFPFLLGLLWRARQNPRWLWGLAPLTLIWANMHGSWLMIPVLTGIEVLLGLLRRDWTYTGQLVINGWVIPLLIVVLLTPAHSQTLTYAWWLDHNREITTYISEWQSINFHQGSFAIMAPVIFGAWFWRSRITATYPFVLDLWFIGITVMFFDEVRMVAYFGVVLMLWWGHGLGQQSRYQEWRFASQHSNPTPWAIGTGVLLSLIGCVVVVVTLSPQFMVQAPTAMVRWLNSHPHAQVFNPIGDGGYLLAQNVHGVYIDGRADFYLYNDHRFQWYVKIVEGVATPAMISGAFHRQHVNTIVWPTTQLDTNLLWFIQREHWQRVYHGGGWSVFIQGPG